MAIDSFDDDRPTSRSPKLFASVDSVSGARASSEVSGVKTSPAKLRRLRLMAIIEACRNAPQPVPYSTLIETLGISRPTVDRLYRLACRRKLHRSRV